MILPDVNVLVQAFRPDYPQHRRCRAWLESVVSGGARFGMAPLALSAVVRITTDPRIMKNDPSSIDDAFGFCDDLLQQPHCQVVTPGERHWDLFQQLCIETPVRGPDVADAWFAALAIEWACDWVTLDRGFARFKGLSWQAPVELE
jgi:toxin-antitoxin system PIN domain toxin